MAIQQEIDKAVGAHGMWKTRLKTAIQTGKVELPVATIKQDNQCDFGKWINGAAIPAGDRASAQYRAVKELHAKFHAAAATVAELAIAGKKDQAEKLLATGGEFANISSQLTAAMMDWKRAVNSN